ncbi:MAG TPA: YfhO family protein [Candidatus Binatia bacterium]
MAIIGSIIFTLGGATVSMTNVLNHFQAAVWLPWVVLLWERYLKNESWRAFLALAFVSLLQFLAGSPELYAMSMALLLLDGVRIKEKAAYGRSLLALAGANALVAGLAMVQILPTVELFYQSWRAQPVSYGAGPAWSLYPQGLLNLFFVDKQMNIESAVPPQLFFLPHLPLFVSLYIGNLALVGVIFWLYYASTRERAGFVGLIVVTVLIALGDHTPIYQLLFQHVPFFSVIRFPEKFVFLTHALILFIAFKGLNDFFECETRFSFRPVACAAFLWVVFLLAYLYLRIHPEPLSGLIARTTDAGIHATATIQNTSAVIANLEMQLVLMLGIILVFFLGQRKNLRPAVVKGLLIAIAFFDLNSVNGPYQFLLNPEVAYGHSRVLTSPDPEPNRLFYFPAPFNLHPASYFFLKEPSLREFQLLQFGNLMPNTGVFHGFDYMQETDALGRWPYTVFLEGANQLPPDRLYRLLGELNVKYINTFRPLPEKGATLVRYFPEYPSWLYKIDRVVPRAYIATTAIHENNPRAILSRLSSDSFDPFKQVVLDKELPLASRSDASGNAAITRYENRVVEVDAFSDQPGILVLADSFYPGWRAYVDGREEEILRANLFFRGVAVQPGRHRVEFRYEPASFLIGLIVSMLTLGGVVIGSCALVRRQEQTENKQRITS